MEIRPMVQADLDALVALLGSSLGDAPGGVDRRTLFTWKHLDNPAGESLGLVGVEGDRLLGARMFMRWAFVSGEGEVIRAVRAVDTATDASARRQGVFSKLTRAGLELAEQEGVDLVFNTPNKQSAPGYLKMGWSAVGKVKVTVRARRPLRLLVSAARRDLRAGPAILPSSDPLVLSAASAWERPDIQDLVARAEGPTGGIRTVRSLEYLRWRYGAGPIPYHVVLAPGAPSQAVAVVRLRSRGSLREADVVEVFADPAAAGVATLLRSLPSTLGVDQALTYLSPSWPWRSKGYRHLPGADILLTARPIRGHLAPDPTILASWALTLGDLELF